MPSSMEISYKEPSEHNFVLEPVATSTEKITEPEEAENKTDVSSIPEQLACHSSPQKTLSKSLNKTINSENSGIQQEKNIEVPDQYACFKVVEEVSDKAFSEKVNERISLSSSMDVCEQNESTINKSESFDQAESKPDIG